MSATISGSITASGASNGLILPVVGGTTPQTSVTITVEGTFTVVTLQVQGTTDASPTSSSKWFALAAVDRGSTTLYPGGTAITLADSTPRSWYSDCRGLTGVRVYAEALTTGPVTTTLTASAFFGTSPIPNIVPASTTGTFTGAVTVTAASANALAVGPNGTTNPTLKVNTATSSAVTGVSVTSAASGSGVAVAAISSNTNEGVTIDAKGSGIVTIASLSTGGANVRVPVQTVAASGTAIGNAAAIVEGFTYVTAANNALAVKLPVGAVGMQVTVVNAVYTAGLIIFPQVNSAINNLSANASYNLGNGGKRIFTYAAAGQWYTDLVAID